MTTTTTAAGTRVDRRQHASPATLLAVTGWRAVIVATAVTGLVLTSHEDYPTAGWRGISQLATLAAAVVYVALLLYPFATGLAFHEPRSPWARGAVAVPLILLFGLDQMGYSDGFDHGWTVAETFVLPLLVVTDLLVCGRNLGHARWSMALTWLVAPVGYVVYYSASDLSIYEPQFTVNLGRAQAVNDVPALLVVALLIGLVVVAAGRLRTLTVPVRA